MTPPTEPAFVDILARARRGDERAWRCLYLQHAPAVLGYLRSQRLGDAEDVLGDVWLQAVRDLSSFHGDEPGFRSWLLRIAHHRLIDARRARAARPVDPAGMPGSGLADRPAPDTTRVEQIVETHATEREFLALLRALPERQRAVLYLRYVLDLDQAQSASVLGVSRPALKMLQGRALRSLRRRLEHDAPTRALPDDDEER